MSWVNQCRNGAKKVQMTLKNLETVKNRESVEIVNNLEMSRISVKNLCHGISVKGYKKCPNNREHRDPRNNLKYQNWSGGWL